MTTLRKGALAALLFCLCACTPLQTKQLRQQTIEPAQVLLDVPFVPQDPYYCGPASVSMLLQHRGQAAQQQQIAQSIYLPGRKGTLQADLKAYIRQQGLIAYAIPPNLNALLAELQNGNPVLVLQNLSFDFWPRWHYAVVIGYDTDKGQLILHTGKYQQYRIGLGTFERTWARSGYWGITALDPNAESLQASGNADSLLEAVAELDTQHARPLPISLYKNIARQWPRNSLAWFSLGNAIYQDAGPQNRLSALKSFVRAAELEPNPGYYNNLAYVAAELGCAELSRTSLNCGLALAPNNRFLHDTQQHPPTPIQAIKPADCPVLHCNTATP